MVINIFVMRSAHFVSHQLRQTAFDVIVTLCSVSNMNSEESDEGKKFLIEADHSKKCSVPNLTSKIQESESEKVKKVKDKDCESGK